MAPISRARSAAAAIALALSCGCSKEMPTTPAPGTITDRVRLAFLSDRPPSQAFGSDIYFYDLASGGPVTRPPNLNSTSLEGPCGLSADGRRLAFYSNRFPIGTAALIFVYDTQTHVTTIPHWTNTLLDTQNPALSGDGRYLATQYVLSGGTGLESYVAVEDLVADSLLRVPTLNVPGYLNFDPSLNGDASLVAFASDRPGEGFFDIYLYSVPGDSLIPLPGLNSASSDLAPSISADGRYIAFQSSRLGGTGLIDVYLYDRQSASLVPLPGANTALADYLPAISPDGHYVAYTTDSEGSRDVRVYDVRGQRLLELPGLNDPYFYDYFPSLSSY